MKLSQTVISLALLVLVVSPITNASSPIKNVVVLMMENRSFDHFLGWLKELNPEVDGLTGSEFNPTNTSDPSAEKVFVTKDAVDVGPSPEHSVPGTTDQVFGHGRIPDMPNKYPATMDGFVEDLALTHQDGRRAMDCFHNATLPVLFTLAQEYAVFDRFYASVPGPTEVNRAFAYACTSDGMSTNENVRLIEGLPNKSIFNALYDHVKASGSARNPFGVYFEDFPTVFFNREVRDHMTHFHPLDDFFTDVAAGTLPMLTWLEPKYFHVLDIPANDHHPAHNVKLGELLIKKIYEAIRASPQWDSTLFLITFDEHGGFADHVPTPLDGVPNPDGKVATSPPFGFDRLGVRVPFIAVSPLIPKGTVVHEPEPDVKPQPTSRFSHASLYASLKNIFGLTETLTKRDAWAAPFDSVVSLTTPRTDCPTTLPDVPDVPSATDLAHLADQPVHDFQATMIRVAAHMSRSDNAAEAHIHHEVLAALDAGSLTEGEAAAYLERQMSILLP
ncbi:phosphatidylglycerol specific phospholipase C [Thecamonas trahens ATCC 50062]|uniref:Phosphatidylglycerol specific phospholipase C n=1 Tax=Thecamonas trahens ATCC 50062 TaxID=461836 RepID=A0A0L0DSN8_THETB|nr:phosphatidylglycerol specific phospholipase C [Thecamonas trahens ATCC 50062]KNC55222.1 phosphatidylglycerol specific phospholipase C [Thecamonas trahens ATCC 50062]|eukprot:XP_013753152.1 phosphatidylglycerol specific phospholipase C [Thecamonas trahens ATCC 50062]